MADAPDVFIYQDIEWDGLRRPKQKGLVPPEALVAKARATGARRKRLVKGEGGFYMNRSVLPPEFRVPPHHHNYDELIVVLAGGCTFDGGTALGPDDAIVIRARYRYGFTCGPEGMEFLTIRMGDASVELHDEEEAKP